MQQLTLDQNLPKNTPLFKISINYSCFQSVRPIIIFWRRLFSSSSTQEASTLVSKLKTSSLSPRTPDDDLFLSTPPSQNEGLCSEKLKEHIMFVCHSFFHIRFQQTGTTYSTLFVPTYVANGHFRHAFSRYCCVQNTNSENLTIPNPSQIGSRYDQFFSCLACCKAATAQKAFLSLSSCEN